MYTIIVKFSKVALTPQCVQVYTWAYIVLCTWTCKACVCCVWCACKEGTCFFRNMDSKRVWFMAQWLKVEPKQSTLFFNKHISFSIMEEEVHAIGELDEATLAWQTWESILFFKTIFFLEIKAILFFKVSFSFKVKLSFEDKISFFFKISL